MLIVQKFGGSSLADLSRLRRAAGIAAEARRRGNELVLVVSAAGDSTDELLEAACQLDGTPEGTPVMHPLGLLATTTAGALAATAEDRWNWVKRLWDAEPRKGVRRYYDNCLYFFSLLMAAGRYRNWME